MPVEPLLLAEQMHPIGVALCVLAGLFVVLIAILVVKTLLDNRRPDLSTPAKRLAHHVLLLGHHDTDDAAFRPAARRFAQLFSELVPDQGPADSVQGEVIRSVDRLASEERRNGNGNWSRGFRAFAVTLRQRLLDEQVFDSAALKSLREDVALVERHGSKPQDPEAVRLAFGRLIMASVTFCQHHPEPMPLHKDESGHKSL